jgi:hypothetical protein
MGFWLQKIMLSIFALQGDEMIVFQCDLTFSKKGGGYAGSVQPFTPSCRTESCIEICLPKTL